MAKFKELPPEILMQIAKDVHPRNMVNFAILNRKVYHSISDTLQLHRNRIAKYQVMEDQSLELYRNIIQDPASLWFIRTFFTGNENRRMDQCSAQELKARGKWLQAVKDGKNRAIHFRPGTTPSGVDIIKHGLLVHSDDFVLSQRECREWTAKFIWLSSMEVSKATFVGLKFAINLTTLVICAESHAGTTHQPSRESTLIQCMNSIICEQLLLQHTIPFPCLKRLGINYGRAVEHESQETSSSLLPSTHVPFLIRRGKLVLLMMLPTLETLSIRSFGGEDRMKANEEIPKASSTVRHLDLGDGEITKTIVRSLVRTTRALESFSSRNTCNIILGYLLQYHAKTLVRLNIGYQRDHESFIGSCALPSLKGMSVLTNLHVSYQTLFRSKSSIGVLSSSHKYQPCVSLRECLPQSIRKLSIRMSSLHCFVKDITATRQVFSCLISLVQTKNKEFPQFIGLCINGDMSRASVRWPNIPRPDALQKACDENNVIFSQGNKNCPVCERPPYWLYSQHGSYCGA